MALVKLQTSQKFKANQTNILPYAGEVTFNEDAEIELDDTKVDIESLISILPEFSKVENNKKEVLQSEEEDIKKKSEDNEELGKSDENEIQPQVEESEILNQESSDEKPSEELILKKLEAKTATELKEMLKQFPEELVKDLKNKNQYINFLVEQLSSQL